MKTVALLLPLLLSLSVFAEDGKSPTESRASDESYKAESVINKFDAAILVEEGRRVENLLYLALDLENMEAISNGTVCYNGPAEEAYRLLNLIHRLSDTPSDLKAYEYFNMAVVKNEISIHQRELLNKDSEKVIKIYECEMEHLIPKNNNDGMGVQLIDKSEQ